MKVYQVLIANSYGEYIVGICETKEIANLLKQKIQDSCNLKDSPITYREYIQFIIKWNETFNDDVNLTLNKWIEANTEYDRDTIDKAITYYVKEGKVVYIVEKDLICNNDDLKNIWNLT